MNLKDFGILTAKRRVVNEDWKTALAHEQPAIEKGQQVTFVQRYNNYYGNWIIVKCNGNSYYVREEDFEGNFLLLDCEHHYYDIRRLDMVHIFIYKDRYGKKYELVDEKTGELESYEIH